MYLYGIVLHDIIKKNHDLTSCDSYKHTNIIPNDAKILWFKMWSESGEKLDLYEKLTCIWNLDSERADIHDISWKTNRMWFIRSLLYSFIHSFIQGIFIACHYVPSTVLDNKKIQQGTKRQSLFLINLTFWQTQK